MKNRVVASVIALTIGLKLFACSPQQMQPPSTATFTKEAASFPLSEPGPYWTGDLGYTLADDIRDGGKIILHIWYPALKQTDAEGKPITRNAIPNMSEAPYPLILSGPDSGNYLFKSHLASYGFVMVIVTFPMYADFRWDYDMIDYARDLLFVLDQIATYPPEGLEGVIDTDHVGVTGYSGEGNVAFALSGARIDPEFYRSQCKQVPVLYPGIFSFWPEYACSLIENWEAFAVSVGSAITENDDGLWQPITDERIRTIVSMAATSPWMYGERGLAAVDRPVLVISPTEDEWDPHEMVTDIYQHIGNPKKVMISFIGRGHMMVDIPEPVKRIKHFATAFFGYHLQGRDDYAEYFSEDFVSQYDDLVWGVYEK